LGGFIQEKETLDKILTQVKHDLSENQAQLYEEGQKTNRLQMELASKDSEIELLFQKITYNTSTDSTSVNSHEGSDDLNVSISG